MHISQLLLKKAQTFVICQLSTELLDVKAMFGRITEKEIFQTFDAVVGGTKY